METISEENPVRNALQTLKKAKDELEEGHLYTVVNGNLQEIPRDTEDTLRKVKLMDKAVQDATEIQRELRRKMHGYKPDLTLICSALISEKAKDDDAVKIVLRYVNEMMMSAEMEEE